MLKRRIILVLLFIGVTSQIVVQAQEWIILNEVEAPGTEVSGLAWSGDHLIVNHVYNNWIHIFDINSAEIIDSFELQHNSTEYSDICYHEDYLYISSPGTNQILKFNYGNRTIENTFNIDNIQGVSMNGNILLALNRSGILYKININSGDIIESIDLESKAANDGIAFDGNYLWGVYDNEAIINKINVNTGKIIDSYNSPSSPGTGGEGLIWMNQFLWYADYRQNKIYKIGLVDTTDTSITVDGVLNCINLLSSNESNVSKIIKQTLNLGEEYRISVSEHVYNDANNSLMSGVYFEYYTSKGLKDTLISSGNSFSFMNSNSETDNFLIFLVDRYPDDNSGSFNVLIEKDFKTSIKENKNNLLNPINSKLYENYPNPFNPHTEIQFSIAETGFTSLIIYNNLGREVKRLISKELMPGQYNTIWDGTNSNGRKVSSGVYYYQLKLNGIAKTKKMLLTK